MSWQAYVDDQLLAAGIAQGAILGHDGNPWAVSPLANLKAGEGAALSNLFKNPANVFSSGVTIGGVKYMGIKGDERSIYGKKGAGGLCAVKTGQAIVLGIYDDKLQPGNAAKVCEGLADYLIENGY